MKELIEMISKWGEMPEGFYERLRQLVVRVELRVGEHLVSARDGGVSGSEGGLSAGEGGVSAGEGFTGMYFLESGFLWCYIGEARVAVWYMEIPRPAGAPFSKGGGEESASGFVRRPVVRDGVVERIQALAPSVVCFLSGSAFEVLGEEFPEFAMMG